MKATKIIFFAVGLLILFLLFKTFGVKGTVENFQKMGWYFWIIVSIHIVNNINLTYAWKVLITHPLKPSQFYKLVLARMAGDSTTAISSLGAVAGEPLKAMYIKNIIPMKIGLASVVMDRTIHSLATILIGLTGILASLFILKIPIYITITSLILTLIIIYIILKILKKQKDGFLEYLINFIPGKFKNKLMTPKRWEGVKALDDEIKYIFSSSENLNHFYISLFIHYVSTIIIGTIEIYLIIIFVETNSGFPMMHAMLIYIFGFILTSAMFFMPANVGTSEGSYSLALYFLGHNPEVGVFVGIIRRLRSFVWAGIGMVLLFYAGLIKKEKDSEEKI